MKMLLTISTLLFSLTGFADVWKKPVYTPDENHLPEKQEEQQILQDRQGDQKHQEVKTPQDQIEKDTNLEDLEDDVELKRE